MLSKLPKRVDSQKIGRLERNLQPRVLFVKQFSADRAAPALVVIEKPKGLCPLASPPLQPFPKAIGLQPIWPASPLAGQLGARQQQAPLAQTCIARLGDQSEIQAWAHLG